MNKTCARCEKTVYPTEELKCLDKVWHKGCFKCQECGMTLNMRTYKGYGKLPYCEAHVPKAKHTTMAETPELKRIAENTKIQSNVKYHADFEKSKGKFTQVADDPETLRIKANTRIISNVAYHGDLEKKAQMEKQRQMNENGELVDMPTDYHQQIDSYATEMLPPPHLPPKNHYQTPVTQYQTSAAQYQTSATQYQTAATQYQTTSQYQTPQYTQSGNSQYSHQNASGPTHNVPPHNVPSHMHSGSTNQNAQNLIPPPQNYAQNANLHNMNAHTVPHQNATHQNASHQNAPNRQYHEQYYQQQNQKRDDYQHQNQKRDDYQHQNQKRDDYQHQNQKRDDYQHQNQKRDDYQYQYQDYNYGQQQKIGRIQDYDPLSDGPRAAPNTQRASATLIYNSTSNDKRGAHQSSQSQQQTRQIGRVTELDPLANEVPQSPRQTAHQNQVNQNVFIAMYDYEANDSDEVSFREGDLISNVSPIDEGWMTGQVLRTGRAGMLPANYVAHYEQHQQY